MPSGNIFPAARQEAVLGCYGDPSSSRYHPKQLRRWITDRWPSFRRFQTPIGPERKHVKGQPPEEPVADGQRTPVDRVENRRFAGEAAAGAGDDADGPFLGELEVNVPGLFDFPLDRRQIEQAVELLQARGRADLDGSGDSDMSRRWNHGLHGWTRMEETAFTRSNRGGRRSGRLRGGTAASCGRASLGPSHRATTRGGRRSLPP